MSRSIEDDDLCEIDQLAGLISSSGKKTMAHCTHRIRLGLTLIGLIACFVSNSAPQTKPGTDSKQMAWVNILVTDKQNHQVGGLPKEDFNIIDEGDQQNIGYFS